MTELEYLLLADSAYLDLAVKQNLYKTVNEAAYKDKRRNDRILKGLNVTTQLKSAEVVATRSLSNGLYISLLNITIFVKNKRYFAWLGN